MFEVVENILCDFRTSFSKYQNALKIVKTVKKKNQKSKFKKKITLLVYRTFEHFKKKFLPIFKNYTGQKKQCGVAKKR